MKLSSSAKNILNDSKLIARRDKWFSKLEGLFAGEEQENVFSIKGITGVPQHPDIIYNNPEQWAVNSLEDLAKHIDRCNNEMIFVPPCIESAFYGVHFIDKLFGADVFVKEDLWYSRHISTEIGTLQRPDLVSNDTWQLAKRAALEFVRQDVLLPLFGLPTISSALNVAVNLFGQEILVAIMVEPEKAIHDLKVINELLIELHQWYRSVIPMNQLQPVVACERTQPPGYGQICGCTCQLISEEVYDKFIAPLDNALLGVYPHGGMIHLCGSHLHLLKSFHKMPNLKAVQINNRAAQNISEYYNELREDQIIYFIPCDEISIQEAIEATNGNRLVTIPNQI